MDENIKTVRREKWRKVIMLQKASGLTITEWCEQNGIRARQFHYWQKILRDNALLEMNADNSDSEPMVPACVSSQEVAVPVSAKPMTKRTDSESTFSEICSQDSGITIQYHDMQIHVSDSFNEGALVRVLQVIRNA